MAAIPAPGEAVWLPEEEAPYDQTNTAAAAFPSVIGGPGLDFI
jgi:hypothetical protein